MHPSPKVRCKEKVGEQGFALVVVILVMLMASFLASQLIMQVKTELSITHNVKSRVVGQYLAEAGVNLGLFRLLENRPPMDIPEIGREEDWEHAYYDGYEYEVFLAKGKVSYYIASETGKIDLNKSSQKLIEYFIEYQLGEMEEEKIAIVVDSLLDWRDSDDLHRVNGAESEVYTNLDDPYIARNGKVEDPAEFFLINGTDEMVGKFFAQDIFTVFNTGGKINFNSLTPAMLDFLSGGNQESVEAYRQAKEEFNGKLNAGLVAEIIGQEQYEKFRPYLTYGVGSNKYYTIVGTGYAGVEQGDDNSEQYEDEKKENVPGTINSLLIEKTGARYISRAWQERYT